MARHPRPEQHLGKDRDRGDHDQPGEARAGVRGRHRSVRGSFGDEDDRREDGEGHREVRRHELGGEALEHDGGTQQRLEDHEHAGHDGGDQQRRVAAAFAEERDEPDGTHQRPDEDGGGEPVTVLDPGVQVGRRQPVAEAEWPVGTPEPRIGRAHEAAHGDQDEGRNGSSDRQLGESGQHRVPLAARTGSASGRRHDSRGPVAGASAGATGGRDHRLTHAAFRGSRVRDEPKRRRHERQDAARDRSERGDAALTGRRPGEPVLAAQGVGKGRDRDEVRRLPCDTRDPWPRVEDGARDLMSRGSHPHAAIGDHPGHPRPELDDRGWQDRRGHAEPLRDQRRLRVVRLLVGGRQRGNESPVHAQRRVDQRRVHPQQCLGIDRACTTTRRRGEARAPPREGRSRVVWPPPRESGSRRRRRSSSSACGAASRTDRSRRSSARRLRPRPPDAPPA